MKMHCEQIEDMFSRYNDGELDAVGKSAFEAHLAECIKCKKTFEYFNAAVMLLDESPEVEVPVCFRAGVLNRLEKEKNAIKLSKWWQIDWNAVLPVRRSLKAVAAGVGLIGVVMVLANLIPISRMANGVMMTKRTSGVMYGVEDNQSLKAWGPWGSAYSKLQDSKNKGEIALNVSTEPLQDGSFSYSIGIDTISQNPISFNMVQIPENFDFVNNINIGLSAKAYYSGYVARNQGCMVRVPKQGAVSVSKVAWKDNGVPYSRFIFAPANYSGTKTVNNQSLILQDMSVYGALKEISARYGVVIISDINLGSDVKFIRISNASVNDALNQVLSDFDMKAKCIEPSIYIVDEL